MYKTMPFQRSTSVSRGNIDAVAVGVVVVSLKVARFASGVELVPGVRSEERLAPATTTSLDPPNARPVALATETAPDSQAVEASSVLNALGPMNGGSFVAKSILA